MQLDKLTTQEIKNNPVLSKIVAVLVTFITIAIGIANFETFLVSLETHERAWYMIFVVAIAAIIIVIGIYFFDKAARVHTDEHKSINILLHNLISREEKRDEILSAMNTSIIILSNTVDKIK